jgi:multidrug efflux pump subunit AcrB
MTGAQRLRPVLLTTTTTVLGLLPMALKLNIDFVNLQYTYNSPDTQWWVDLSRAIVFGVTSNVNRVEKRRPKTIALDKSTHHWVSGEL